jgi:hypothetical protein
MYLGRFKTILLVSIIGFIWYNSQLVGCENLNEEYSISKTSIQNIDKQLVDFLGEDNINNILNVDSIYAYELEHVEEWDSLSTNQAVLVERFPIITQKTVSDKFSINELKNLLLSKSNYPLDDLVKKCLFTPEWGLTFFYREDKTHLLISERCQEWKFYHQNEVRREDMDGSIHTIQTIRQQIFLKGEPQ